MKVNLPEPCHQDWNKMNTQEKGRFCGSCQKLVIDFSGMSDTEIISYFKEYKSQNTCGRFKKTQINRTLKKQETPRRKLFLKELAAACFAFFLASTDAKAQGGAILSDEKVAQIRQQREEKKFIENQGKQIAINGRVKNGNENLSNATISVKGTGHKTLSLENGLFSVYIPTQITQNQDSVILVVEYENLGTKEIEIVASSTNQFFEINFEEKEFSIILQSLAEQEKQVLGYSTVLDFVILKGTVKDETGQPLPSATIQIKGTKEGTKTDSEGNYSITVPKDAVLVYQFIGCSVEEIKVEKVKKNESLDIVLNGDFLGEVTIIRKWYSPRGAWYKIRNIFR